MDWRVPTQLGGDGSWWGFGVVVVFNPGRGGIYGWFKDAKNAYWRGSDRTEF